MAIISQTHRFIFIHIPFCAGTLVKATLDPLLQWNDLIIGTTHFGKKMEAAYRERYSISEFSTLSDVVRMMGPDVTNYATKALICDPDHRIRAMHKSAWSDLHKLAKLAELPLDHLVATLREGRGPRLLLNRTPIRAAVWAESDDDFVKRLLALSRQASGISLLSFAHWLKGPNGEEVACVYAAEALDTFRLHLESVFGQPLSLTPTAQLLTAVSDQQPTLVLSEASKELLRQELKYDYKLYEKVYASKGPAPSAGRYQL